MGLVDWGCWDAGSSQVISGGRPAPKPQVPRSGARTPLIVQTYNYSTLILESWKQSNVQLPWC